MIMGIGQGNSNLTQNFAKITRANAKNGGNLLGGLNGDNMDEHDGDENIAMDDDVEYD